MTPLPRGRPADCLSRVGLQFRRQRVLATIGCGDPMKLAELLHGGDGTRWFRQRKQPRRQAVHARCQARRLGVDKRLRSISS